MPSLYFRLHKFTAILELFLTIPAVIGATSHNNSSNSRKYRI